MTIGENIRFLRKQIHMTQQQLADLAGVNIATIRGYESGKYKPKLETIYKLCKALDCDVNEIIDVPLIPDNISFDGFRKIADSFLETDSLETHYEKIADKIDKGKSLDHSDLNFLFNDCIQKYYQLLNPDGQKAADQKISNLLNDLQLLARIPEYKAEESSGKSSGKDTAKGTK